MDNTNILRNRNFRLLLAAQAISALGDRMVVVALAFAVLEVGGSASDVGLVLAAGTAPMVATVLVGGVIGDRHARRRIMVGADFVRVASQGLMAALLTSGSAEVGSLALLAAFTGVATGVCSPASTAILPELVLPSHFSKRTRFAGRMCRRGRSSGQSWRAGSSRLQVRAGQSRRWRCCSGYQRFVGSLRSPRLADRSVLT